MYFYGWLQRSETMMVGSAVWPSFDGKLHFSRLEAILERTSVVDIYLSMAPSVHQSSIIIRSIMIRRAARKILFG